MPSPADFPTRGKIIETKEGAVVFNPRGTTYALHLKCSDPAPAANELLDVRIRATARKVWTVPSGGNFITPIVGTPRIVQGRVKSISERELLVHAGANFVVDLPKVESAVDLPNGPIAVGSMVNITLLPGASIEEVAAPAAV
jgi:hypothetical protein